MMLSLSYWQVNPAGVSIRDRVFDEECVNLERGGKGVRGGQTWLGIPLKFFQMLLPLKLKPENQKSEVKHMKQQGSHKN